jgi:hypothetical protein
MSDATVGQTKQFGKGQRTVPHPAQKAHKWYPVDDESQPKKVSIHPDNGSGFAENTAMRSFAWMHAAIGAGSVVLIRVYTNV